MSYSAELAHRISSILTEKTGFIEKQMFGGIAFMVDDKMCVGISRDKRTEVDRLMARIGPAFYGEALKRPGVREMDFAGRPMTGFIFIHPEGYASDEDLRFWIDKTLEYNKAAPELTAPKKPTVRKKLVEKDPPKTVARLKPVPVKKKSPPKKTQAVKRK